MAESSERDAAVVGAHRDLTPLEVDVLRFEEENPRHTSLKEERIRRRFDRSAAQYYQILGTLIEDPDALAYDPVLIARLRRLRDSRSERREERRRQRFDSAAPRFDKAR
ncbi:DUF3263 domain-containing protein [Pseudoclavibacter chungangensis]|uniref:DUF3263 domain-containing protein n=1 Tax=Pseudoclavibacter chungangensis TaxID=587635 RepID=A0A7J5C0E5_9MICO|nr:DUF3263 domain-containing protein [Pseudoclavibacter chungangensis]KAB1660361.1 DUF3263 domain-containing protein [Pseudoclavibacter chungangensis]NYJ65720.1 hypothetical protein [Pseudoclavibacter chungangensis]